MLTDLIARLRPAGTTSADIAAAMDRARAAKTEADGAVATAQAAWQTALLDADLKELKRLEEKLDDAKREAVAVAARVDAVLWQLEQRFSATKRSEALGELDAARKASEDAGTALATWWAKAKPKLEAMLAEGAKIDVAWGVAQMAWADTDRTARAQYPDVVQQHPAPTGNVASDWQGSVSWMTEPPRPPRPERVPDPEEVARVAERERQRAESDADYRRRNPLGAVHHHQGVTVFGG